MFRKLLILLFAVLLLAGCGKSSGNKARKIDDGSVNTMTQEEAERQEAIKKEIEAQKRAVKSETSGECVLLQQCEPDDDVCWFGKCWTKDELYAEFAKCDNMKCSAPCENCSGSTESCITASSGFSSTFFICADCFKSDACKEGYKCEVGRCVLK